jgi:hypothetical protein
VGFAPYRANPRLTKHPELVTASTADVEDTRTGRECGKAELR